MTYIPSMIHQYECLGHSILADSQLATSGWLPQQVTVATDLSPSFDKWCSLFFAILSGAAAAAALLACPRGVLSIDTEAATSALSQATAALLSQRGLKPDAQVCYESLLIAFCAG